METGKGYHVHDLWQSPNENHANQSKGADLTGTFLQCHLGVTNWIDRKAIRKTQLEQGWLEFLPQRQ